MNMISRCLLSSIGAVILCTAASAEGPGNTQIGPPGGPYGWPGTPQTKLDWGFSDATKPESAKLFTGWDKISPGTAPAWHYVKDYRLPNTATPPSYPDDYPAQWHTTMPVPRSTNPDMPYVDTYIWFGYIYDYNKEWTGPQSAYHRQYTCFSHLLAYDSTGAQVPLGPKNTQSELYYDANGNVVQHAYDATYACFYQVIVTSNQSIDHFELFLGTDFFTQSGKTYYEGMVWQPFIQILSHRQRLPIPTLKASVEDSQGQQQWLTTDGGTYTGNLLLAVSCSNFNATFHYTVDGSEPTESSPQPVDVGGVKQIELTNSCTLRVKAYLAGYAWSEKSAQFTLVVPPATFSPDYGTFFNPTHINVSVRDVQNNFFRPVTIHYTTDGSDPTTASPTITNGQSVLINVDGTPIKVLSVRPNWSSSLSRSSSYEFMVSNVVLHPATGFFPTQVFISATCATEDAVIHYEKGSNPSEPTINSPVAVDGKIPISGSTVLRTKGFRNNYQPGPEADGYYIAGAEYTYLGSQLIPPSGAQASSDHPPVIYSRGNGGHAITNVHNSTTNIVWTNTITRAIYLYYTNIVVAMNAGEVEVDWYAPDAPDDLIRQLYIIQAQPDPDIKPRTLYWNQPPSRGPLVDVTDVPKLIFYYNEDIPAPTNVVHPETVWVAQSGAKKHLNAKSGIGYLVLLYEGSSTNGPLYGIDVVHVKPDNGWKESIVPVGSQLQPAVTVTNPGTPFVSSGTDQDLLYQHNIQGKMEGTVFAIEQNDLPPLMEVFWQEIGGFGFNVNWPYEMHRYTAYWPEENDPVKPARLYIRGDSDDDLGASIFIDTDFNPQLMEAEEYASTFDHGYLQTNIFWSTGHGKSLLQLQTDDGSGHTGNEWVGFEVIKSVLRSDMQWLYRRELRLDPPTPFDDFQVRIVLSSDFSYAHANVNGDDLRFYTRYGQELNYWIEQWQHGGISVIWVLVPDAGESILLMDYGNDKALPLSSPESTFLLYDAFSGTLDNWNATGNPTLLKNGGVLISSGDQLIGRNAIPYGVLIETWIGGSGISPSQKNRGSFCGASTLVGDADPFMSDKTQFISNHVQFADWDIGNNKSFSLAGLSSNGKYVKYGPTLNGVNSNDVLGIAIESDRVRWFYNGTHTSPDATSYIPAGTLYPLLNCYYGGSSQSFVITTIRIRRYAETDPSITFGPEQDGLMITWPIGEEITDEHQQSPGSGYIHESEGTMFEPNMYNYPYLDSQIFGVNTGTIEVWWASWILTNRNPAGIQVPSFLRRYRHVWPGLHTNYALAFDGADRHVDCGDAPVFNQTNQLTIEAWVKPDGRAGINGIVSKRPTGAGSDGYALYLNSYNTSDGRIVFETKDQTLKTPTNAVAVGEWQHVAVAVSGSEGTIYLNGRPLVTSGAVNLTPDAASSLYIGRFDTAAYAFQGLIDDVRLWNTARSVSNIANYFSHELHQPQDENNLIAYYPMNEGTGNTVEDMSGFFNDGTIPSTPVWTNAAAPIIPAGANLGQIIVASSLGGKPLQSYWTDKYIYYQNDPALPGYNPNEEHAVLQSGIPYALRNDLNRKDASSPYTSEPFVLMGYREPTDGNRWGLQVYQVVPTNVNYDFIYDNNVAARMLTPPDPMGSWPGTRETIVLNGPGWKDRNDRVWAIAGSQYGPDEGSIVIVGWFYPDVDTSWYIPSWYESSIKDGAIPLLDRFAGTSGTPVNVRYNVYWEKDYPTLHVSDTLYEPRDGLPDMSAQTSVDIVYQQSLVNPDYGKGQAVQLIDPTQVRSSSLPSNYQLPQNLLAQTEDIDGAYYFTFLPPHLNRRLWYDPVEQAVHFKGEYVPLTSSQIGQKGYMLLNVINERDHVLLTNAFAPYETLDAAVEKLAEESRNPIILTNDLIPFDSIALTAGLSEGTGYVTLAFNNSTNALMQPQSDSIQLQVINVALPLFEGELVQVGLEDNPYDEQTTVRQTCNYAGKAEEYIFDWRFVLPDQNGNIPVQKTNVNTWSKYPYLDPPDGKGSDDIVIQGENLFALDSHYFVSRYRRTQTGYPGGTNWSEWTPPKYVEGWVQRVLDAITPFEQRFYDFTEREVNILVSMIAQAGPRWDGNVPLNPESIDQWGLIQIYMTVMKTAMGMSIEADPPHHDDNANKMIILAAGRLADLYMLLGNEAYADALDTTIAFGTDHDTYSINASTLHCFMNQTDSLLEETMTLLRGRGEGSPVRQEVSPINPPVWTTPFYNRLIWNFTKDITGGEVAYALNYDILDENGNADGIINEADAAILYPQGHGDAWGHYLSALMMYYTLIHNSFFDWIPGTYAENVGESAVTVNYLHEQKFCNAASARARAGAEVVQHTYRDAYKEDPLTQWQGYRDSDTNRAWGVRGWGIRSGMGAYFDWAVGNAVLPTYSPYNGIERIDRTNVSELTILAKSLEEVQDTVDQADQGFNPLGLARNVIPFDINPSYLYHPNTAGSQPHFEQIFDRTMIALQNAVQVFNYAKNTSQELRKQNDNINEFSKNVRDQERDFKYRLIEIFGYPYPDDVGPAGTYPSGYDGPDLYHWMYLDDTVLMRYPQETYSVSMTTTYHTVDTNLYKSSHMLVVDYTVDADSQIAVKPLHWDSPRPAQGEIQKLYADVLQQQGRLRAKLTEYDNQVKWLEMLLQDITQRYHIQSNDIRILDHKYAEVATMNSLILVSKAVSFALKAIVIGADTAKEDIVNGSPFVFVAGLADGVDPSFLARLTGSTVAGGIKLAYAISTGIKDLLILIQKFAKELIDIRVEIRHARYAQMIDIEDNESKLRNEANKLLVMMKELFVIEQALNQAYGVYSAKLYEGYRLEDLRVRFRQKTAAQIQEYRYNDMAFRIFRNDALQKYHAQFDLAARYAYLAAQAYDYETALQPDDPRGAGVTYLEDIVKATSIGAISEDGTPLTGPLTGDGGLADILARMKLNWDLVIKYQLGFNNPQVETSRFSLRNELFRSLPGSVNAGQNANLDSSTGLHWHTVLEQNVVSNIFDIPAFNRYCIPFDPHLNEEPGIVIRFSTVINQGQNFFGHPLAGGDNAYDSTHFATKIRAIGIWFSNYDIANLANEPRVYLFPVGTDTVRTPGGDGSDLRTWKVLDQVLPVPFPATEADIAEEDWVPIFDTFTSQYGTPRRFSALRAYNDSGEYTPEECISSARLIGRSVWNSEWMLIIPASTLNADRQLGLQKFIDNVTDIKIFFQTYSYSGN